MNNVQLQIDIINIVLALIAVVALLAAYYQLRNQKLATRASILLGLDERFASQSMQEAITEENALIDRINAQAQHEFSGLGKKEWKQKRSELYPKELERMRNETPPDKYIRLMRICGFFETVGYVARSKYVPLNDILNLFSPAIEDAGQIFRSHVHKLRDIYSEAIYDNFLWLVEKTGEELSKAHLNKNQG